MATNPATGPDLQARSVRQLSSTDLAVGTTLLGDAWTQIIVAVPSIAARIDAADATTIDLVVGIECAMVLRVLTNPDGKLEEHGDDYGYRLDAARSSGALYISDDELEKLGLGDGLSDTAFTIRPAGRTPDNPYAYQPDYRWPW